MGLRRGRFIRGFWVICSGVLFNVFNRHPGLPRHGSMGRLSSRQATPCSLGSRSKTRGRLLVSEWHLQIWTCLLQWRKAAKARRRFAKGLNTTIYAKYAQNMIIRGFWVRLPNQHLCKQLGFVQSIPDVSAPYPHHGLWPLPTISVYHPRSGGFIVALKLLLLLLLLFSRVRLFNEK